MLKKLQREFNLTYLFISHDLSVVRYVSDEVYVMYLGQIVEAGKPKALFEEPIHPYTQFLINAVPIADPTVKDREKMILEGDLPSAINPPSGCRFRTRCPYATEICTNSCPELVTRGDRKFACHHPLI